MLMTAKEVFKHEVLTVTDFAKQYGNGVEPNSIYNAIKNGSVDYTQIGRLKLIVLTELTRQYTPNRHPKREQPPPAKKNAKPK